MLPVELGHQVLAKHIHSFLLEHPNNDELELTNREVDIIGEGIDLYAQIGELVDLSLVSRLTTSRRVLAASPEYLEQFW